MAKKAGRGRGRSGTNKSQAIRDYIQQNPDAGPTAVAEGLNAREGWKISAAYVSTIKNKLKQPATTRKRGSAAKESGLSEKSLMQAKELCKQAGGINQAKAALELLARLTS